MEDISEIVFNITDPIDMLGVSKKWNKYAKTKIVNSILDNLSNLFRLCYETGQFAVLYAIDNIRFFCIFSSADYHIDSGNIIVNNIEQSLTISETLGDYDLYNAVLLAMFFYINNSDYESIENNTKFLLSKSILSNIISKNNNNIGQTYIDQAFLLYKDRVKLILNDYEYSLFDKL